MNERNQIWEEMDDRTIDFIFAGSLEHLPPVSSKIVRIFTSSTFTGKFVLWYSRVILYNFYSTKNNKYYIKFRLYLIYNISNLHNI